MKNFIQRNIENVSGNRRGASLIERQPKYGSPIKAKNNYISSFKNSNQTVAKNKYRNIQQRMADLEQNMYDLSNSRKQQQIMEDISEIKNDIKMIKSYIFHNKDHRKRSQERLQSNFDEQETLYASRKKQRMKSYGSQTEQHHHQTVKSTHNSQHSSPHKRIYKLQEIIDQKMKRSNSNYPKYGISVKNLVTLAKDYKLEGPDFGTIFYGYSKRTSQPIVLKYSQQGLDHIIEVYDRLWKSITKAEWTCINRIYDFKSEDTSIVVMEKNRSNIVGLPYKNVLIDIIKILEFIHDCGYLYRNIQPEHFMLNQEQQLVIIDFKRAKRYVDIRGHAVQVSDTIYTGSPFASNNQVRGLTESRKDDLQSLGYLALLLLEMQIPWAGMTKDQVIKIRSSLTLQQLYQQQPQWMEYMAYVTKLQRHERPDYRYLCHLVARNG